MVKRADFSQLSQGGYGLGFHWTTATVGADGSAKGHKDAILDFDVEGFVRQAVELGAGHVLLTSVHSLQWFPGPHEVIERLLPGRTSERDLVGEIGEGLARQGIKFILYYHHGTDGLMDPAWQEACGARKPDQSEFYENYHEIVGWMGKHYGKLITAFWFDAGYGLCARGAVPWEAMTATARLGNADRLVTYNSGIENLQMYTVHQDFWSGEVTRLNYLPRGTMTPVRLPWYAFLDWHCSLEHAGCGQWVYNATASQYDWPAPPVDALMHFDKAFSDVGGVVTYNMLCYQDGSILPSDRAVMSELKRRMKG